MDEQNDIAVQLVAVLVERKVNGGWEDESWIPHRPPTTYTHGDWRAAKRGGDQAGTSPEVQSPAVLVKADAA